MTAPLKILVVNSAAPFIHGGAEELAINLTRQLNARSNVEAELLRVPFRWDPPDVILEEVLLNRRFELINVDRVIALKFPAYLIPHPHKTLWLLHQFRQAYDLADAGEGLPDGDLRRAIRTADNVAFAACRKIFVNSPVTQRRLSHYNGFASEVLYPPLNDEELFTGPAADDEASPYIFAGGRVSRGKRQHLLVEAMAHAFVPGRLIIAGPPDTSADAEHLLALVERLGLQDRVELHLGFHPRAQIAQWVRGARAAAYLPVDEDSLGYVTMEAFAAGKGVLTTTDAGGLLEIVGPDTGLVVAPNADMLGRGLERLLGDRGLASRLGAAARAVWQARALTWSATIEKLLQ